MDKVGNIMDNLMKMDFIELSFSDISVYRADLEEKKVNKFQEQIEAFFNSQTNESKEANLTLYITRCEKANLSQLKILFDTLDTLVKHKSLSARVVCEQLLTNDKMDFKNELFFVESFKMIKRLIGGVDYKGVREIMKGKDNKFIKPNVRTLEFRHYRMPREGE